MQLIAACNRCYMSSCCLKAHCQFCFIRHDMKGTSSHLPQNAPDRRQFYYFPVCVLIILTNSSVTKDLRVHRVLYVTPVGQDTLVRFPKEPRVNNEQRIDDRRFQQIPHPCSTSKGKGVSNVTCQLWLVLSSFAQVTNDGQ